MTFDADLYSEPRHRVTALTAYAADSLGQRLVFPLSRLLLLPFETALMRYLALGFLSADGMSPQAQAAASRMKGNVYPIGAWFGLGSGNGWRGMSGYATNMLLCMGINTAVGFGVWQVGMGLTWWIGRKRYQWGRL